MASINRRLLLALTAGAAATGGIKVSDAQETTAASGR